MTTAKHVQREMKPIKSLSQWQDDNNPCTKRGHIFIFAPTPWNSVWWKSLSRPLVERFRLEGLRWITKSDNTGLIRFILCKDICLAKSLPSQTTSPGTLERNSWHVETNTNPNDWPAHFVKKANTKCESWSQAQMCTFVTNVSNYATTLSRTNTPLAMNIAHA